MTDESGEVALRTIMAIARDQGLRASVPERLGDLAIGRVRVVHARRSEPVATGDLVVPDWDRPGARSSRVLDSLLRTVSEVRMAALVVPREIAHLAGDLPVVAVDDEIRWTEIAVQLGHAWANARARRDDVRRAMVEAVLAALGEGAATVDLVAAMGRVLACPILMFATDGALLAGHEPTDGLELLAAAGDLLPDGRARVGALTGAPVVIPLARGGHPVSLLCAFPDHAHVDEATVAATAVAPMLALALHAGEAAVTDRHLSRALLLDIIGDDLAAREQAARRAGRLGLLAQAPFRVLDMHPVSQSLGRVGPQRLATRLEPEVLASDPRAVVVAHHGAVVAVVASSVDPDALVRSLRRRTPVPLSYGVSEPAVEIRRLPTAFRQARRASQLGCRIPQPGGLTRYAQLGAFRLLYLLPEHERHLFVREVLKELAVDSSHATELRRTLRMLLEEQGNVARASRRLFVHYNTLRYRIEQLEGIVGPFMSDSDHRLTVQVALALHRIEEPDEPVDPSAVTVSSPAGGARP